MKKIKPGDLKDVVEKLSVLQTNIETCAYTLFSSFVDIGDTVEAEAEKTRRTLELASARLASVLTLIEKSPAYLAIRRSSRSGNNE